MDDSEQKKKSGNLEASLAVESASVAELAERRQKEIEERAKIIRRQAQEMNTNREKMQTAMEEKAKAGVKWQEHRWKAVLFFAAALVLYFISLATKDKNNFNDAVKILKSGAWQLLVIVFVAWITYFVFGKLSAKKKEFVDRLGVFVFLGVAILAFLFMRGVIGLVFKIDSRGEASGAALWLSKEFLFTLAIQVALGVGFFRIRKNILKRQELGESVIAGAKSIVVLSEGLQIYLWLGVFLQVVFQVHMLAVYGMVFSGLVTSFLFLIPLFGYFFIRKYLLSLN